MTKIIRIFKVMASFIESVATFLKLRGLYPRSAQGGVLLLPEDNLHFGNSQTFMLIESEKLVFQGGIKFTSSRHPYLRFYSGGRNELARFYKDYQPRCPSEKHFLKCDTHGHSHNNKGRSWIKDIPWEQAPQNFSGDLGISPRHGHQSFEPAPARKADLQAKRLRRVLGSIEKFGFQPDGTNRLPRGYFLEDDEFSPKRKIFYIVGGQHRVSALVYLGWQKIPVCFQPGVPRIIRISQIKEWPGVVSGRFSENQARAIFGAYFRTDQEWDY